MKKEFKIYIVCLLVFLLFVFKDSLDYLVISLNHNFDYTNQINLINASIKKENEELKKIIDFNETLDYNFITTKVKYRNIYAFLDELEIYKGTNQGLKVGDAIINEKGLVGTIKKTFENTSIVELITNKNSQISVKINGYYGILCYQDGTLVVRNISADALINPLDEVYTSGLGNLPENLYIGKIKDLKLDNLELEKIAVIDMAINLNELMYVTRVGK